MLKEAELTDRQRREREHYDRMGPEEITHVAFDHFERPRFGPWNPNWYVHDFVKQFYRHPEQRLLSFGCGTGGDALRYAKMGYHVSGFDVSSGRIENARRMAAKYDLEDRVDFSVQVAENLEYASESFDIVVGEHILHHVDIDQAIRETFRVLKPGGAAIFKDSMKTPVRDRVTKIVRKVIPREYRGTEDETPLTRDDLRTVRDTFSDLQVIRWRVLAVFNSLIGKGASLEKLDWAAFKVAPVLRRLGDHVVLVMHKP